MIELGIVFVFITIWCVYSGTKNGVIMWDGLKSFLLSMTLTIILLSFPFLITPNIEPNREPYISSEIHWSKICPDIELSQPVFIYEFKIDRPFTWLGDGKFYKIVIPPSNG